MLSKPIGNNISCTIKLSLFIFKQVYCILLPMTVFIDFPLLKGRGQYICKLKILGLYNDFIYILSSQNTFFLGLYADGYAQILL